MTLQYFTLIHVLISLAGIAAGFGVLSGLLASKLFTRWNAVFLATTATTSVTGFFFPFHGVTPGVIVGVISLVAMAIASYSLFYHSLIGAWRNAFVIASVLALYLNVFVLVAQLFQKTPALMELSPGQTGPPFAFTQGIVFIAFAYLGFNAIRSFRNVRPT